MPPDFRPGVVIPVGAGREENLKMVLDSLADQDQSLSVVIVYDGTSPIVDPLSPLDLYHIEIPKHEPGMEQPRNVGVRILERSGLFNVAWFVDSDVIVAPDALTHLRTRWQAAPEERVIIAPYDWLPPGVRTMDFTGLAPIKNDPRWPMIEPDGGGTHIGELNVGLGCFSGNLLWPISEFTRIGGFWNDIHHGRCEDGELGLRAVAHGTPITMERGARGYHLHHPVNHHLAVARNTRDVPMLNARHPWVQGEGMFVVEQDGRRFDQRCGKCGTVVNTLDYWAHAAGHQ